MREIGCISRQCLGSRQLARLRVAIPSARQTESWSNHASRGVVISRLLARAQCLIAEMTLSRRSGAMRGFSVELAACNAEKESCEGSTDVQEGNVGEPVSVREDFEATGLNKWNVG